MRVKAAVTTAVYDKALKAKVGAAEMSAGAAAAADKAAGKKSTSASAVQAEGNADASGGNGHGSGGNGQGKGNGNGNGSQEAQAHEAEAEADMRTKKKTVGEVNARLCLQARRGVPAFFCLPPSPSNTLGVSAFSSFFFLLPLSPATFLFESCLNRKPA